MAKDWIDVGSVRQGLAQFFTRNKREIQEFGSTVNQTFEAFVFASVVNWYLRQGWNAELVNSDNETKLVKLKFSTRGRPNLYTYARCTKADKTIQIRHGLRVATKHHRALIPSLPANVVLDVAVLSDTDLSQYGTDDYLDNLQLITFGEAKHMAAFAELIASFIGLVHELIPDCLTYQRPYIGPVEASEHIPPFLYVSGHLNPTARGIVDTIRYRGFNIDIYDHNSGHLFGIELPVTSSKKKSKGRSKISKN